jgi:hypothetical protein
MGNKISISDITRSSNNNLISILYYAGEEFYGRTTEEKEKNDIFKKENQSELEELRQTLKRVIEIIEKH